MTNFFQKCLAWIGNNKLSSFLIVCTFAFVVSTWTLAAVNAELRRELDEKTSTTTTTTQSSSESTESTTPQPPTPNLRLTDKVLPISYDLFLHPNIQNGRFSGNVKILLSIKEPTSEIVLHSNLLNITSVKYSASASSFELDPIMEQLKVKLTTPASISEDSILEINFDGALRGKIVGFYQSTYKHSVKGDRTIATSKFEPTFARQSFPCFDEPAMKATFKISLISPDNDDYHALSNMDIEKIEPYETGLTKYTFKESVPMSTYLTVFIISDFGKRTGKVNEGGLGDSFDLSVYATPEQVNKTQYAFDQAKTIIEFYINYFQIPYPLPKLDLAAIPDFVSGAMETWGLVTYRETNLLYDPATSSAANKKRICAVIAHELAHMWFGNLVTMRWWNDLWLNEGFASYIEFKGMANAEPSWNIEDQFTSDDLHGALELDATLGSHPIVTSVETPEQITEIFDTITYSKGASIIRMIEDFVGPENFQKGVTDYLNEMRYKTADSDDLLRNLKKYADEDIFEIVNTWIRQKGFPVVNVKKVGNNFELTQKRFFTDPESADKETVTSEYNYKWSIPITFITSDNQTVQRSWFYNTMFTHTVIPPSTNYEWIKFNKNQAGYYRVNYENEMWESLGNALNENPLVLSVLDRAHILNDVFSLAQAGEVSYEIALTMTQFLRKDTAYVPWEVVSGNLKDIKNLLYNTEYYKSFLDYVNDLVDEPFSEIVWEVNNDEYLNNLFRIRMVDLACSFGHSGCLQKMSELFRDWLDKTPVTVRPHPDLRQSIYYYGMKNGGTEEDWNKVFELLVAEPDASEKAKLQHALTAIDDPIVLSKYLELASANETYVRNQDYFSFLSSLAGNRKYGEALVWDYVRGHWLDLVARFGLGERNLGRMIPNTTANFAKEIRLQEMEDFFAKYPEAGAGVNARIQALESIRNNIKWLKNNKDSVGGFLNRS